MIIHKLELCGKVIWQVFSQDRLLGNFKSKTEANKFAESFGA
jgi:hypothetical protein